MDVAYAPGMIVEEEGGVVGPGAGRVINFTGTDVTASWNAIAGRFDITISSGASTTGWARDVGPPATVRLAVATDQVAIGTSTPATGKKLTVFKTGSDAGIRISGLAVGDAALDAIVTAEAVPRISVSGAGAVSWSGGALAADVRLLRGAAGRLTLDDGAGGGAVFAPPADNVGQVGTDALRFARVRAVEVVSGDMGFDDDGCANCGRAFVEDDTIQLQVRKVEDKAGERRLVLCVPVHAKCPRK